MSTACSSPQPDRGRPSDALQAKLRAECEQTIHRIYGALYSRYGGDKASNQHALL